MPRRRRTYQEDRHERWLISYADFITLLFAFFVVMFASSRADREKAMQVSQSVKAAFEQGYIPPVVYSILGGSADDNGRGSRHKELHTKGPAPSDGPQQFVELLPSLKRLNEDLREEIDKGRIELSLQPRGLVVSLKQAAFFPSGGDYIPPETHEALEKVASVIRKLPNPVRLEGHTDAIPINNYRYRNNWELSSARSIAMLELFEQRFHVPRAQMAVSGYADTFPVGDNGTEQGRAQNRRVDILIMNERGSLSEPERKSVNAAMIGAASASPSAH